MVEEKYSTTQWIFIGILLIKIFNFYIDQSLISNYSRNHNDQYINTDNYANNSPILLLTEELNAHEGHKKRKRCLQ